MVATRGQGRKRPAQQEEEPPKTDYERRRDARVAENDKMFQALGLKKLATELNNSLPQSATTNNKTSSEYSDTSEYLLENDDQGDSDDDEIESVVQPQPTKSPRGYRKVLATRKKKTGPNMPPGVRANKRVRAPEGSQVQPPMAQLRSSKRLQLSARDGQTEDDTTAAHDEVPQRSSTGVEQGNGAGGQDITAIEEVSGDYAQGMARADEDNIAGDEGIEAPAQRAPREPRPPTKGAQLERMTKAMGRRLPIAVVQGKRRPNDLVQAAKLASESGVIIRDKVPILTHWKEYKKDEKYYKEFVGKLCIRQQKKLAQMCCALGCGKMRYRLKKKYFDGVPANEIRTTSPVSCMTDDEWNKLVAKWKDPKNMQTSEKNKRNHSKVKYHQKTGSRSYVAHLHKYKQNSNNAEPSTEQNEELDVVEAFKTYHTSSKHGLDEAAREAISNMEALRAAPVAEGETGVSGVQVVSQVLSKNSSNIFLKNIGIKPVASCNSAASNESELREQLAAEAKAAVQGELEKLKKRSEEAEEKLERTRREMEEMKKLAEINQKAMDENNVLLNRILALNKASLT